MREGLTAVISVKVPEPQFEGQTKTKLGNSEVKGIVEALINEKFSSYLNEHPPDAKKIVAKVKDSKLKVQASIQGDTVRITGKDRDTLQQVIALLKGGDYGVELQFTNFRSN